MERWAAWSAPLLGGCGGCFAGLALTGDPRFPFPTVYAMLGGAALGVFAGLVVWLQDKLRPAVDAPPSNRIRRAISAPSSRRAGFLFTVAGTGCLAANHILVVATGRKMLPLVVGGALLLAVGLAGVISPHILTAGATGERVPWWDHLIGGILAAAGLALGFYLWLAVY